MIYWVANDMKNAYTLPLCLWSSEYDFLKNFEFNYIFTSYIFTVRNRFTAFKSVIRDAFRYWFQFLFMYRIFNLFTIFSVLFIVLFTRNTFYLINFKYFFCNAHIYFCFISKFWSYLLSVCRNANNITSIQLFIFRKKLDAILSTKV